MLWWYEGLKLIRSGFMTAPTAWSVGDCCKDQLGAKATQGTTLKANAMPRLRVHCSQW